MQYLLQGTFDHGFFGHRLKMPPAAGLGGGQRQVRLA